MKLIHRIWVEWAKWHNYQLLIVGILLGAIVCLAVQVHHWQQRSEFWQLQYIQHFPLKNP